MTEIRCKKVTFYSKGDEDMFFAWAQKITAVTKVFGELDEIILSIESTTIDDNSLRELIALLYRYRLPMKELTIFKSTINQSWFCAENKFWHNEVFGRIY